jgi:predicted alpha/beta-hydrolase family hydrolase
MTTRAKRWRVTVADETTSALVEVGDDDDAVFVCAHGAGGNMEDSSMVALARELRARSIGVVRFNFLYSEKGIKRPDRMPKVIECYSAVVARVRKELAAAPQRLVLGGRSMGGRAASMMAAEGFACDGLVLYAYPLHPAEQPEKLRDAHLPAIQVPVLCFNGTRDDLCTPSLMKRALKTVRAPWQQVWLEGADHSFHVLKSSGTTDAAVLTSVADTTRAFITSLRAPA